MGVKSQLDGLVEAIIRDRYAEAKRLLTKQPALAKGMIEKPKLERRINHWIYAKDSPLHVAAAGYRIEIAQLLLDAGADPKAVFNHRRGQPLHYAADGYIVSDLWNEQKQLATIRLLLKAGADINAQDKNGATPLHRAVRTRCAAAVKWLLEEGADTTIKNKPGSTAFHLAVQNTGRGGSGADKAKVAQQKIINAFLAHGISPKLKDAKGKSVLDWAKSEWIRGVLTNGKS